MATYSIDTSPIADIKIGGSISTELRVPTVQLDSAAFINVISSIEYITGTEEDDQFREGSERLHISGLGGNDTFIGGSGNSHFDGGEGTADTVDYSDVSGSVRINVDRGVVRGSGSGRDTFENVEFFYGSHGNDFMVARGGTGWFFAGNDGNDVLKFKNDASGEIWGGDGNDKLVGGSQADYLSGGAGNDRIFGNAGDDVIYTNEAMFTIDPILILDPNTPDDPIKTIDPVDGREPIQAANTTSSSTNIDYAYGGRGNDLIIGDMFGRDFLRGNRGNDTLEGHAGNDNLKGGSGHDDLDGGIGDDILKGGTGDDRLEGGAGNDTLHGGEGQDIFVFNEADGAQVDRIRDFEVGVDQIEINGTFFLGISDVNGAVRLDYGHDQTVYIYGVTMDQLSSDDFIHNDEPWNPIIIDDTAL